MRLTSKQIQIMRQVIEGNMNSLGMRDSWLDMDQLLERLPYKTSKESLQFSVRFLTQKGLLEAPTMETRRGKRRRILVPTVTAMSLIRARITAAILENDGIVEYE